MVKQITKYLFSLIGLDVRKNGKFSSFDLPNEEWSYHQKGYNLKLLDLTVTDVNSPLITGYRNARNINQHGGGRFFYDANQQLRLSIQGINFFINFADELFVINEVFATQDYNFKTTDTIVVMDIGQNIGATSLFFAKQENVKRVYAYELFPPTYQAAQKNLSLNDTSKIISQNVGLGKDTRELSIPYSIANKAVMGLNAHTTSEKFPDATQVKVFVKDVAEEVLKIDQLEPGVKRVCKMDCEGAEFEILDQLFNKNVASLIDIYIIEWHDHDTQNIESQFLKSGFDIIKSTSSSTLTGLIYAFKKSKAS
jgi:FkbM family methyltransferase